MTENKKKTPTDKGRTFTIALSIVIALLLWSYVIIQVNPTKTETISRVPVQLLNVQSLTARQLAILGDEDFTVDVVVEGRRADIIKVSSDDIVAEVDLFGWSKGENYIPVNVKVPQALKLVEVRSAKIQITIEDLVALSKPVVVSYRGDFSKDTEEGDLELSPAEIEVTGAKSAVESVHEIRIYVDVANLSQGGSDIQCEAVPYNDADIIVENVKLSSNYVNYFARLLQIKEVALVIDTSGTPGEGLGVEINGPQSVIIKGTKAALKEIDSVTTEKVEIDKVTQNGEIALSLILPDNIELSKKNPKPTATVSIEQTAVKEFTYSRNDVFLEGLTQGRIVTLSPIDIKVTVTGRKQIVDQLSSNQLELYIDAAGLKAGSEIAPIKVSSKVSLHNITVEPAEILITITDTEQENVTE